MKFNKLFILAGIALAGLFVACSDDDDFSAGPQVAGEQAYFPADVSTKIQLDVAGTSFNIPVMRVATDEATIPVKVYTNSTNLTVPTSVKFKADEKKANFTVTYDPNKIVIGQYDTLQVTFEDGCNTPYGLSSVTFLVGVDEPWNSIGTGKFTDYGWMDGGPYEVEYQQSGLYPNHFRLVSPYGPAYEAEEWTGQKPGEYLYVNVLQPGEVIGKNNITITQKDLVYFQPCVTGYYVSSYDATLILTHPADFGTISKTTVDESFCVYNKVDSYQENGLPAYIYIAPMWYMDGVGSYSYWNKQYVELIFPGVTTYDFESSIKYTGIFTDAEENVYAVADVALGADVASAKVALAAGKDAESLLSGITSGEIESITMTQSGEVKVSMPYEAESGDYTVMVVAYDAAGTAQAYDYATFKYTAPGAAKETWTPAYVGTFTYSVFFGSKEEPYDDEGLVLSVSSLNENRFKISHVFYDVDFVFEMDANGNLSYEDQFTGYTHDSYGDVYVGELRNSSADYANYVGSYKDGAFLFYNVYFVSAGSFGAGAETFKLTGKAEAKSYVAAPQKKDFTPAAWKFAKNLKNSAAKANVSIRKAMFGTPKFNK